VPLATRDTTSLALDARWPATLRGGWFDAEHCGASGDKRIRT